MPVDSPVVPSRVVSVPARPSPPLDHLSWSSISMYAQCPQKFYLQYIAKAEREMIPASLIFGQAFHRMFEVLQQARLEGGALPSIDELLDEFNAAWLEEAASGLPIQYGKAETRDTMLNLAQRMVQALMHHTGCRGPAKILAIEHAERFKLLRDAPPLEMRLDLLELTRDTLIVTDLKTSRSSWSESKIRENMPQLVVYAHGIMPMVKALGVRKVVPRFLVVTKGKTSVVQLIEPKATQEDTERVKQRVAETWSAIRAGVFVRREGWGCRQCPFRRRCLG